MNFFDALRTSASGMHAQRLRMNLISRNLANAQTTRTEQGGPYRRKTAVLAAGAQDRPFDGVRPPASEKTAATVRVAGIIEDPRPPLIKFDPQHPDADDDGYVAFPNINVFEEMVDMIAATRSYEANLASVNATKAMVGKALEIGR